MSGPPHPAAALLFHEGMLLAPQHFQRLALRAEQLALLHAAALSPHHWGVRGIELDTAAIPAGLVRVLALDGAMPDGLPVQHRAERDPPLELDLSPWKEAASRAPATVHLVVPAGRAIAAADGTPARFEVIEAPEVTDEAGTAEPIALQATWGSSSLIRWVFGWWRSPVARIKRSWPKNWARITTLIPRPKIPPRLSKNWAALTLSWQPRPTRTPSPRPSGVLNLAAR